MSETDQIEWTDGAHENVGAGDAMKSAIAGDADGENAVVTKEDFEARIRAAVVRQDLDYDTASDACAKLVLDMYEKYPNTQTLPMDGDYLRGADGKYDLDNFISITTTIYDVIRKMYDDDSDEYKYIFSGLSGFMWGWAVNAARSILELDEVQNPALMMLGRVDGVDKDG